MLNVGKNGSICCRSVIYYEEDEYEFVRANIELAKKHNYPEKLMPKLLAREENSKKTIKNGNRKGRFRVR